MLEAILAGMGVSVPAFLLCTLLSLSTGVGVAMLCPSITDTDPDDEESRHHEPVLNGQPRN